MTSSGVGVGIGAVQHLCWGHGQWDRGTLSKFPTDTELCGAGTRWREGSIQRDLDRLERGDCANLTEFNKAKGKVLPMGRGNPRHKHRLGEEGLESSPKEKDLGVLVGGKLPVSQQHALAAQKATRVLGCTQSSVGRRARGGDSPPLLRSRETPLQCWVQLWRQQQKDEG